MKNKSLLLLLFSISVSVLSFKAVAQFREIYKGPNSANSINAISFISPATGFVAFNYSVGFTQDSGRTFTTRSISIGNTNYNGYVVNLLFGFKTSGIIAFSSDSLFITGDYGYEPSILFSSNQGQSWKLVYHTGININAPVNSGGITDIKFPGNGAVGFAVHHDELLKTTNRGQTWVPLIYAASNQLRKLSFPTTSIGFAIGYKHFYKTVNSGTTWTALSLPTPYGPDVDFNNVFFLNENIGYITDHNHNTIFKTINSGATWVQMNNASIIPVYGTDMHFTNDSTGFITAESGYEIYNTTDNGRVWELCKKNTDYQSFGNGLKCIHFYNNQTVWAGGEGDYLLLSTSGGTSTIPASFFKVDTSNLYQTSLVNLVNISKPGYQYRWYRNGILFNSSYQASYTHTLGTLIDTIKLVVSNGVDSSSALNYVYFNPPVVILTPSISSFFPLSASIGNIVTIKGTKFTGTTSVKFGTIPAMSFTVLADTLLSATVGIGASGSVTVTTQNGTATKTGFTYFTPVYPIPSITSFNPASGPVGTLVTITGTNFSTVASENTVHFGAVKGSVISSTANMISVLVPAGATNMLLTVTTNQLKASSNKPFLVVFSGGGTISQSSFAPAQRFDGVKSSKSIVLCDMDEDGKADFVTRNYPPNPASVLRNISANGLLSLAPPVSVANYNENNANQGTIATDLDGDGLPDLAITNNGTDFFSVFRNTGSIGNISFGPRLNFNTRDSNGFAEYPQTISFADFNLDGKTDIVVGGNDNSSQLRVFKNTSVPGYISFAQPLSFQVTGSPLSLVTGDVDGDNKPDIIAPAYSRVNILKNISTGSDILFDANIELTTHDECYVAALADLDADSKPDLIAGSGYEFSIFKNSSAGGIISFENKVDYPMSIFGEYNRVAEIAVSDLDGDGRPDLAMATTHLPLYISLFKNIGTNSGVIAISERISIEPISFANGMAIGDLDYDGKPDISFVNYFDSSIYFLKNIVGTPDTMRFCPPMVSTNLYTNLVGSNYQWQVNSGSGYINLQNSGNYGGTITKTLQLINVPTSFYGYTYRCLVDGNSGNPCTIIFENMWLGRVSDSWTDPVNWLCGTVPDANTDVFIFNGTVVINSDIICGSLTVSPNSSVTVNPGYHITITH